MNKKERRTRGRKMVVVGKWRRRLVGIVRALVVVVVGSILLSFYSSTISAVMFVSFFSFSLCLSLSLSFLLFFLSSCSFFSICVLGILRNPFLIPPLSFWDEGACRPSVAFTAAYIMASTTRTPIVHSLSYCITLYLTYIYIYIHTHIHIYTYICKHAYTHILWRPRGRKKSKNPLSFA